MKGDLSNSALGRTFIRLNNKIGNTEIKRNFIVTYEMVMNNNIIFKII